MQFENISISFPHSGHILILIVGVPFMPIEPGQKLAISVYLPSFSI